jgi:hypothetical protein
MPKDDPVRRQMKKDITNLDYSITDMELDLQVEEGKGRHNSQRARSLKAQIIGDKARLKKMKDTLKELGG